MIFADLLADHKAQLGKAEARFPAPDDGDFKRHLANAAPMMCGKRPRILLGILDLAAEQIDYAAPSDLLDVLAVDWGRADRAPAWDTAFVGYPPLLMPYRAADGAQRFLLSAPPTVTQIAKWGALLAYRYFGAHEVSATRITVADADRPLLLLAAMVEALRELAADATVVQLQKGLVGLPTAGTPAYLHDQLLRAFLAAP